MADTGPDYTLIYATHPGIDLPAQMPRAQAADPDNKWTEITGDPSKSSKLRDAAKVDPILRTQLAEQSAKES